MTENLVFNGGESPLAAKKSKDAAAPHSVVHVTSSHSSGGEAPDPLAGKASRASAKSASIGEPPLGGVVRARKK